MFMNGIKPEKINKCGGYVMFKEGQVVFISGPYNLYKGMTAIVLESTDEITLVRIESFGNVVWLSNYDIQSIC